MTVTDTGGAETAAAIDTSSFKMLHTMIRVKDLEKSIDFYTKLLGAARTIRAAASPWPLSAMATKRRTRSWS